MFYNSLEDVVGAICSLNPDGLTGTFDASCFDGRYVTPEVTPQYLADLEGRRGAGRAGAIEQHNINQFGIVARDGGGGVVLSPSCGNLVLEMGNSQCETLFNEA